MPLPERTWRDVAVYRTYPMSREACAYCSTVTGYYCEICDKPVCGPRHQQHSDWHWQNPGSWRRGISEELIEYQGQMTGIHDDRVEASSLGMMAFYERLPWYKRAWWKMKRAWRRLV